MTFFYDLNKKLADLAKKQTLAEDKGSKPDFLDMDKDGDKKEPMKKAVADKGSTKSGKMFGKKTDMDESALQAYLGKKKYGDSGMKALQQAGRDGASKQKMAQIRARHDKMDEAESVDVIDAHSENNLIKTLRAQGLNDKQIHRRVEQIMRGKATDPRQGARKTVAKEADMEEGNEFSGELVKARAQGAKEFRVDGKSYPVKEAAKPDYIDLDKDGNRKETMKKAAADKKKSRATGTAFDPEVAKSMFANKDEHPRYDVTDTGYSKRYTRKMQDEPEANDEKSDAPKVKGRPKGSKRAIGAKGPTGRSKLMSKDSIKEMDAVALTDKGEYDQEGDMARDQLHTLVKAAKELHGILADDDNLPEWVQSKITKALDYIKTANDYMDQEKHDRDNSEPVAEKAVSQAQRRAAGIAHAAQKGDVPKKELRGASKEMVKMPAGELKKFAKTKETDLPKKVKEADAEAPKEKKSSGGYNFGGGVYESLDRKFKQALTEGMNVSVNMSTGQDGQPTKSINISADGEDADKLADLLKMAGLHGHAEDTCNTCGQAPCSCQEIDENSPDWPTNTETSDNALQYSGGLNGPKSTGQTTVPVIASQLRRQVSMEESVKIENDLFKLYQNYKAQ